MFTYKYCGYSAKTFYTIFEKNSDHSVVAFLLS